MSFSSGSIRAALRSPLLPYWLVVALLPVARSAELGTALCLVGTILLFVRHPHALREHPGARCLLVLLGAYVAAAAFSSIDSVEPGRSWSTVAGLLRFFPLGLYACFAIRRWPRLRALYVAVAGVVGLWVLDAWMQMLTGWSLAGRSDPVLLSGIFGAGNLKLGPALAVLSPFLLWTVRERWGVAALWGAVALVLGPVLLAGERSAWVCYALVVLAFAWRDAATFKRFMLILSLLGAMILLAGFVAWQVSPRFEARVERSMALFGGSRQGIDEAISGRLDIWRASVRMAEAHPFNGVGVRAFRYAYPDYAPANDHFVVSAEACGVGEGACHAHQLVLEILTETGVVGLALWLAALAWALRFWRRAGRAARAQAFPVSVALGVMLFPVNTHLAFYSAWWGLVFAWLLGLWCASLSVLPVENDGEESVHGA